MKLTDRRFWIFEALTVLFAGALMLLELIILGKPIGGETVLFVIGWCCVTSAVAWPLASGKHWLAFGLIYWTILTILLLAYLMIDGLIGALMDETGFLMCLAVVFPAAAVCLIPSMLLACAACRLSAMNTTSNEKGNHSSMISQ